MAIVRLKEEIPALENRRVNRLKEFQARKTNMLGLETVIKEAEKEKRRAYLELAIYAVLAAMFAVLAVAGRSIVGVVCFLLLALVVFAQSLKVRYALRKLNDLKRNLLQIVNDTPQQKELLDKEIKAIDSEIAKKKQGWLIIR